MWDKQKKNEKKKSSRFTEPVKTHGWLKKAQVNGLKVINNYGEISILLLSNSE